jgi:DNA gyrase subunit A
MLVTDAGKLIRTSVDDIRIVGRKTQGVMLLRTAESESVVSVARLADLASNGENGEGEGEEGEELVDQALRDRTDLETDQSE